MSSPQPLLGIINYEIGNLRSVEKALQKCGAATKWVRRPDDLEDCCGLVLPGVGAFGDCIRGFDATGLRAAVTSWIDADRPFFGICVGYQMLFESSEESPGAAGLGILPGRVVRFSRSAGLKVPQIGWNTVRVLQPRTPFLEGIPGGEFFYFVHSYYPLPGAPETVALECDYGVPFAAAACRGNLFATQFHPEKSQHAGLRLLANFVRVAAAASPAPLVSPF